jgi:hypothetical protein
MHGQHMTVEDGNALAVQPCTAPLPLWLQVQFHCEVQRKGRAIGTLNNNSVS